MRRYELSDQQWARIAPLFPQRTRQGKAGRPPNDHRPIVNGILWVLHTGAPWRDLPERYGPWPTVYTRFNGWRRDGTWVRIVTSLLDELDDKGQIDHDLWCIDGSVIRARRAAAGGGGKKGSRSRQSDGRSQWLGGRKQAQMQEPLDHALGARAAALPPRSIWFVTNTVPSLPSMLRPGRRTRASRSSRRWLVGCSTAVVVSVVGRSIWRGTRVTATRASAAGVGGDESRQ